MAAQNRQSAHSALVRPDADAPVLQGDAVEEELARLLKERSVASWETLFERHFDRIYRYALGRLSCREGAQDVAAATFDRALTTIDSYSYRGRPILAWLYGIAGNIVKETLRNEARERGTGLLRGIRNRNGHQPDDAFRVTEGDSATALAARMDLHDAMRLLTRVQREVVLLRYFAGLSANETGQIIGRPETAVYALQARALAALRRHLA